MPPGLGIVIVSTLREETQLERPPGALGRAMSKLTRKNNRDEIEARERETRHRQLEQARWQSKQGVICSYCGLRMEPGEAVSRIQHGSASFVVHYVCTLTHHSTLDDRPIPYRPTDL